MAPMQDLLNEIVEDVRTETGVPGLALCLAQGSDRWFTASGTTRAGIDMPVPRDARFDVSCLMKFFLSVSALKLKTEGKLDLTADVATILPELGTPRGICLLHLMSHASGYHGMDITDMTVRWNSSWPAFSNRFRGAAQLFVPGTVFNYEHSEHVVLGEALRALFDQSPSALVQDVFLSPAGVSVKDVATNPAIPAHAFSVQRGAYMPTRLPPFGPFWGASLPAMTITLDDVVSAAQAALKNEMIASDLMTPLAALPRMARSESRTEQPPRRFTAAGGIYDGGVLGHNGSMFGQTVGFRACPSGDVVVAAGVNAYSAHARDSALQRALDLLVSNGDRPVPTGAGTSDHTHEEIFGDLALADLEGRYVGSYLGELNIAPDGDGLLVTVGPQGNRQSSFRIDRLGARYTIKARTPVALRFHKVSDQIVLHLGVHAYKRHVN